MRRHTADARVRDESNSEGLPAFWVAIYLVAVLIVGVAAGTLLARHEIGGMGEMWRLLPMLLVGELIIYLAILVVPGEKVVPPGRALFGVAFGMAIRALMAFLTASALRLSSPLRYNSRYEGPTLRLFSFNQSHDQGSRPDIRRCDATKPCDKDMLPGD